MIANRALQEEQIQPLSKKLVSLILEKMDAKKREETKKNSETINLKSNNKSVNFILVKNDSSEVIKEKIQAQIIDFNKPKTKKSEGFLINENGTFLDLVVNVSNKKDVLDKMKNISIYDIKENDDGLVYNYDDVGIVFYFNYSGIIREIVFDNVFKGKTEKGLHVGDSIEKAIELYGEPLSKTEMSLIWPKLSLFFYQGKVTYIRIQKFMY